MHTQQQIQDIGLLNKGLQLLNIDVSLKPGEKFRYAVACRFVNNEDGSLRWLWPASAKAPQVLRFQYEGTQKSRSLGRAFRAAFSLRMPWLVSRKVVIYTTAVGHSQLQALNDWAIFTGHKSASRKLVIWHENKEGKTAFTKLSLSINAAKNIYTERTAFLEANPEGIVAPANVRTHCLAFTQEDLFGAYHTSPLQNVADLPVATMQRWLSHGVHLCKLSETSWYKEAQAWLQAPRRSKDSRISEVIMQKMRTLMDCMLPQAKVPVARAHGDFVPWNCRRSGEEILLIDWQHSRNDLPALYDLFHFIYQSNVVLKGNRFAHIRREIDETLRQPEWEQFLLEHDIDPGEAEQQYLLCAVSRHLQDFSRQSVWYRKTHVLIQTWCEALGFWMDYEGLLTQRQIVLQDVTNFLHNYPYAAMKLCDQDITMLPVNAGLELCIPRTATAALTDYLQSHRCVERVRSHRKTFARELNVMLSGGSSIHISCISELRIGSLVVADIATVIRGARFNEVGVRQPSLSDDLRFTRLQYILDGLTLPHQYRNHYQSQNVATQVQLLDELNRESQVKSPSFASLLQYDETIRRQSVVSLKTQPANQGWSRIRNLGHYCLDLMRSFAPRRGFIITFSGIDDSGTRTIIEATRHRIRQELRVPVVVLPHRPSFFSFFRNDTARVQAAQRTIPFRGEEKLSFARMLYGYVDYLLAQCYVQLRYVMRGYVVLYDHYFDLVDDSTANRVVLPAAFTAWWYRFLIKPDLNVLLYEPSGVDLERRLELSLENVEELTRQYLELFNKLERHAGPGHFISVRNSKLGETMETLFNHLRAHKVGNAA